LNASWWSKAEVELTQSGNPAATVGIPEFPFLFLFSPEPNLSWLQVHSVGSYMRQADMLWRVHEAKCAQNKFIFSSASGMTTTMTISASISVNDASGKLWVYGHVEKAAIDGHEVSVLQPSNSLGL